MRETILKKTIFFQSLIFLVILFSFMLFNNEVLADVPPCSLYASPTDFLRGVINSLRAGDVLCLRDGVYNQALHITVSGRGEGNRIIIRALNDGKVIVDGRGNLQPLIISGNYITIEGIVFENSSRHVVEIDGNHNILRRVSAYNAKDSRNNHVYLIIGKYNLLEDCIAGGTGRYLFGLYETTNNTLRRCFADWKEYNGISPRAAYANYGADRTLMENCIGTNVFPNYANILEYFGVYQTHNPSNPKEYPTDYNRYYGCIFYRNLGGMILAHTTGPHTEIINSVFFNQNRTDPTKGHPDNQVGRGLSAASNQSRMVVRNCTFVNNLGPAVRFYGSEPMANSVFVNNGTVLGGNGNHEYCDFYQNKNIGGALNQTDLQVDPGFKNGSYLYIPDDSPLKKRGKNGEDIGANVIYQYQDGILTDKPLWPWPMEERICDELGVSVTWEKSNQISAKTGKRCEGGLWKTLDGVYSNRKETSPDINQDSRTDIQDLGILLSNWEKIDKGRYDINQDGRTDSNDADTLLSAI